MHAFSLLFRMPRSAATALISCALLLSCPAFASAASLSMQGPQSLRTGESAEFDVMLDSGGASLNAVEGTLAYSADLLSLDKVSVAGSPVDFWMVSLRLPSPRF